MPQAKILLVDDDARVRRVLSSMLSHHPGWEICGEAADGQESIDQARATRPDLVLMDVSMPRMNGLDATRVLRREIPQMDVILVSQNDSSIISRQAVEVGARAYCSKSDLARNLLPIIERTLEDRQNQQTDMSSRGFERSPSDQASNLLAAIIDSTDDAIVSKTLDGIITSWNKSAERMFGYAAAEAIGKHVTLIIPRDRWEEEADIINRLRHGERVDHFQTVRRRKDGSLVDVSLTISPVKDSSGQIIGASKVARDITAQVRAAEALRDSQEEFRRLSQSLDSQVRSRTGELQELSWQLMRARDEERRHVARELHDSAGQSLAVVAMEIDQLLQKAAQHTELAADIEQIRETVRQLHSEIRTTSYLLHPPLLDESGLQAAIGWYAAGLTERTGLAIDIEISDTLGRLPRDLELVLFRFVQEALTNIHRHAGAKKAGISMFRCDAQVTAEVRDDGAGMSPERLNQVRSGGSGVGIRGMRERILQFQGAMQIGSDSTGTRISVVIPVPADHNMAAPELKAAI